MEEQLVEVQSQTQNHAFDVTGRSPEGIHLGWPIHQPKLHLQFAQRCPEGGIVRESWTLEGIESLRFERCEQGRVLSEFVESIDGDDPVELGGFLLAGALLDGSLSISDRFTREGTVLDPKFIFPRERWKDPSRRDDLPADRQLYPHDYYYALQLVGEGTLWSCMITHNVRAGENWYVVLPPSQ